MDQVTILVGFAATAWLSQIGLGWLQIRTFNNALSSLRGSGEVRIGRSSGRFSPRVIVALTFDDNGVINDNFVMKGMTVFARPARYASLQGLNIGDLNPENLFPKNKSIQQALTLAITSKL